ncbi:helix-turn-helix transcriptional regulator [Fructilactobacillus sp. Tb1]|uniref:helix-turn-helix transcriptional regulator n=1 Tax=Fructilactobacillus sp. Tb1 TaxID=3422304 RepID=UPI003D2DCD8C
MKVIFAQQLKKFRQKNNLSQEALANQLFLSRQAISKWEAGDTTPDLNTLIKLTKIFNCSLDELVFGQASNKEQIIKEHHTNFWDFAARYWWLFFPFVGTISYAITEIIKALK